MSSACLRLPSTLLDLQTNALNEVTLRLVTRNLYQLRLVTQLLGSPRYRYTCISIPDPRSPLFTHTSDSSRALLTHPHRAFVLSLLTRHYYAFILER